METRRTERTVLRQPEPAVSERDERLRQEVVPQSVPAPSPSQDEANDLKEQAVGEAEPAPEPPEVPVNVDVPAVTGTASVGSTLTCTMGNWSGEPTSYTYQWKHNAINVGTGGSTYVIAAGDAGHSLTCVVTAINAAGSTTAPPSNAIVVPAA